MGSLTVLVYDSRLKLFSVTAFLLYPLKTSEFQRFFDVSRVHGISNGISNNLNNAMSFPIAGKKIKLPKITAR